MYNRGGTQVSYRGVLDKTTVTTIAIPGMVLSSFLIFPLIFSITLRCKYYYPHSTNKQLKPR